MSDLDVQDAAAKADNMVNPAFLAASMIEERAPDIVEALNDMPPELAVAVLLHLPPDRAIEVLDQPELEREPELITLMPRTVAAKLLAGVSADRLADIFRQVKEPHCSELLDLLDPDTRVNIRHLLEYPKHTAGSIMTTEFASVPSTYTVGQALERWPVRNSLPNPKRSWSHGVAETESRGLAGGKDSRFSGTCPETHTSARSSPD